MNGVRSKLWTRNFILLVIGNLFLYSGFQMLIPVFPVYIQKLGGNSLEQGLVVSLFAVSALIFRSITGTAVDRYGRKPLLFLGFLVLFLFNVSFLWVSVVAVIVLLRFLHGIGWGMASTSIATIMSDEVPDERRGEGTGYYALSVILATSLSPILAIILMNYYGFQLINAVSTVVIVIAVFFELGMKIKPQKIGLNQASMAAKREGSFWNRLFEKRALLPSVLCLMLAVPFGALMAYMMVFGKQIGMTDIWIYFIGHCFMILVSRPFIGKLFDKKGHVAAILPGAICMLLGLVILSFTKTIPTLILASIFYGFGFGAAQPSLQAWAVNRSPSDRKGAANGTFLSAMDLGAAIGTLVLNLLAAKTGYALMYRYSALFMVAFLLIYLFSLVKEWRVSVERKAA